MDVVTKVDAKLTMALTRQGCIVNLAQIASNPNPASTSGTYVIKGGQIQGDTINQMSETNIAGDLQVNNTEMTQKILQDHSTF